MFCAYSDVHGNETQVHYLVFGKSFEDTIMDPLVTDGRSILGGPGSPTSGISISEETLGIDSFTLPSGCGLRHILSRIVWCALPWGHPCTAMLWCCGTLSRTPCRVGCVGFEYRRHRVQLDNCLPRLPKSKLKVGASPLSKFTISLQSPLLD